MRHIETIKTLRCDRCRRIVDKMWVLNLEGYNTFGFHIRNMDLCLECAKEVFRTAKRKEEKE